MTAVTAALASVWTALLRARPSLVAAAVALHLAGLLITGERWRIVVSALGARLTLARTTLINLAGIFVRNATPTSGLGGDASRVALLRMDGVPMAEAAASFAYVRLAELPSLLLLIAVSVPVAVARVTASAWWIAIAVAALGLAAWLRRDALQRGLTALEPYLQRIRIAPSALTAAVGWATLAQVEPVFRLMAVAAAFGMTLSLQASMTVTALAIAGGLVPTIGSIGPIDGALVAGLMMFGASTQTAIAITIVERAISYGVSTALGAAALTALGGRRALQGIRTRA